MINTLTLNKIVSKSSRPCQDTAYYEVEINGVKKTISVRLSEIMEVIAEEYGMRLDSITFSPIK